MTLVAVTLLILAVDDPKPVVTDLNAAVLGFAKEHKGEKVGNGECATLAMAALRELGLRPRISAESVTWGKPRDQVEDAQPGDILQFENVQFIHKRKIRNQTTIQTYLFARHTAIVAGVKKTQGKTLLTILHQNAGFTGDSDETRRKVSEWTLDLADLTEGKLTAYQPSRD